MCIFSATVQLTMYPGYDPLLNRSDSAPPPFPSLMPAAAGSSNLSEEHWGHGAQVGLW